MMDASITEMVRAAARYVTGGNCAFVGRRPRSALLASPAGRYSGPGHGCLAGMDKGCARGIYAGKEKARKSAWVQDQESYSGVS